MNKKTIIERKQIIQNGHQQQFFVVESNGDLTICVDYSVTINKFSILEQYLVLTLEDLLTELSGGKIFTKIDLSQAYNLLERTPESRKYTQSTLIWVYINTNA